LRSTLPHCCQNYRHYNGFKIGDVNDLGDVCGLYFTITDGAIVAAGGAPDITLSFGCWFSYRSNTHLHEIQSYVI